MELGLEIGQKKLSLVASRASRCVLYPFLIEIFCNLVRCPPEFCANHVFLTLVQAGQGIRGLFVENLHLDEEVVGQPK